MKYIGGMKAVYTYKLIKYVKTELPLQCRVVYLYVCVCVSSARTNKGSSLIKYNTIAYVKTKSIYV